MKNIHIGGRSGAKICRNILFTRKVCNIVKVVQGKKLIPLDEAIRESLNFLRFEPLKTLMVRTNR